MFNKPASYLFILYAYARSIYVRLKLHNCVTWGGFVKHLSRTLNCTTVWRDSQLRSLWIWSHLKLQLSASFPSANPAMHFPFLTSNQITLGWSFGTINRFITLINEKIRQVFVIQLYLHVFDRCQYPWWVLADDFLLIIAIDRAVHVFAQNKLKFVDCWKMT